MGGAAGLSGGDNLLVDLQVAAARNAPRSMTMSISVAPAVTSSRTSASFVGSGARPNVNAVSTLATCTGAPPSASTAVSTRSG
jgi:hypothetical protein